MTKVEQLEGLFYSGSAGLYGDIKAVVDKVLVELKDTVYKEIDIYVKDGQPVKAIKLFKAYKNCSLKVAKDFVDERISVLWDSEVQHV